MNPRALWAAAVRWYAGHSTRDRRILLGVALAAGASLLYVAVVDPIRIYRRHVGEEIGEGQEDLERSARFLGAADSLRAEREQLKKRLEDAKTRLLPGDSGTLGAAALQERANAIATTKGITVQSTQVMREETAEPFRKVAVRLTLSGELKPFTEFLAGLEYGPQQLTVPFVEISRRGAVAGAKGPRTLSATVEVNGYLGGTDKAGKPEGEPAPGEAEASAEDAGAAVPEGEGGGPGPKPSPSGEAELVTPPPIAPPALPPMENPEVMPPPPVAPAMPPQGRAAPPATATAPPGAGMPPPAAVPPPAPGVPTVIPSPPPPMPPPAPLAPQAEEVD